MSDPTITIDGDRVTISGLPVGDAWRMVLDTQQAITAEQYGLAEELVRVNAKAKESVGREMDENEAMLGRLAKIADRLRDAT